MADPASAPPTAGNQGLADDYIKANKGPHIVGIITAIVAISTVFVFARIFVRRRIMGKLEVDDWIIILGAVSLPLNTFQLTSYLRIQC